MTYINLDRSFIFTLLVVLASGNPAINILGQETAYILIFSMLFLFWLRNPVKLTVFQVAFVVFFVCLFFLHSLIFGWIVVKASLGFIVKILIAVFAVRMIPGFFSKYIEVMFLLSLLSFAFYFPTVIGVDLRGLLSGFNFIGGSDVVHIGVHNFQRAFEYSRNCGVFWEPGAFAGYLVLAIFLSLIFKESIKNEWVTRVLVLALITTQSTTGFIAAFVVLVVAVYGGLTSKSISKYSKVVMPVCLFVIVLAGYASYAYIEFIGDKINSQLILTSDESGNFQINRFGNILFDLSHIYEYPVTGWGANPDTRIVFDPAVEDLITGQGVGLTGFIVKFGVLAFLLYYYYVYRSMFFLTESKLFSVGILLVISVLLIGEQYLNYPLFYALAFVGLSKNIKTIN